MKSNEYEHQHGRPDRLLRASDVAEILNICPSSAYQKMKTGEIRSVHMGRSVRVRLADLEEYIRRCLSGGQSNFLNDPGH